MPLTRKQRLTRQILSQDVDRIATVGGWMQGLRTLAELAGASVEQYLADPMGTVIAAYRVLDIDGMLPGVFVPENPDQIRSGHVAETDFVEHLAEALRDRAEAVPDTEREVIDAMDLAAFEAAKRQEYTHFLKLYGDITIFPTDFSAVPNFMLYASYGYEAYLEAIALYPEHVGRIYWESGVGARARNEIMVRLLAELDVPPAMLTGQDMCTNAGPMCDPEFLRKQYWPHAKHALGPLVDAGIRPVHHSDGNIMPILDDILTAGFGGFQGLQYECGVDPWILRERTTVFNQRPILMAGLHITRTLPYGTPEDVAEEIDWLTDCTGGGEGLVLFSSNVIGPEVSAENIAAGYAHAHTITPTIGTPCPRRPWPFGIKHPDR